MSRYKVQWLDLLSKFDTKEVTMKPGGVHVLGDVLPRAPHLIEGVEVTNMDISRETLDLGLPAQYYSDQLFGPII